MQCPLAGGVNLGSPLDEICKWPSYMGGKRGPKKEADHSRLIGGGFNKQDSLHMRLVLGNYKLSRSLHPSTRILRAYTEVLMGFSHAYSPDGLNHTWLFPGCIFEGALVQDSEQTTRPEDGEV